MSVLEQLHANREEILAIAEKYGVKDVRVFGSVARGEETADSDIDLLINVTENCDAFGFLDFQSEMKQLYNRDIDIVFERGLFKPMAEYIAHDVKQL